MEKVGKKGKIKQFLIVIIITIALIVAWFIIPQHSTENEDTVEVSQQVPVTTRYYNSAQHFSLRYNTSLFSVNDTQNDLPWRSNSTFSGIRLVTLKLPKTFQDKTNFLEGFVSIGVSSDTAPVHECLHAINGEVSTGTIDIQGITFHTFTLGDAGAGNFYETTSYRSIHNEKCFALESVIHYTNIGNYDAAQGIREFNHQSVEQALRAVINSFRFE